MYQFCTQIRSVFLFQILLIKRMNSLRGKLNKKRRQKTLSLLKFDTHSPSLSNPYTHKSLYSSTYYVSGLAKGPTENFKRRIIILLE